MDLDFRCSDHAGESRLAAVKDRLFGAAALHFEGRCRLMPKGDVSDAILEPSRRRRAIPSIKELWHLPETDVNDAGLEDEDNDSELLRLMTAGEERGFVSLYRKYQSQVYRFALQISGARHIAEEVTQETFLALIRGPHKYRSERGPLLLYLFGIARNLVWKSARRDKLFGPIGDQQELPELGIRDLANDLARKEQAIRLRHAVLCLPRKYREVIVLCALQELSYDQAATVIGSSIGTVRSRMHRAKQLLLRKLKGAGLAPEAPGSSVLRCSV
jgi:RNA polymerase sigma-70 factor, ECF subfamily